MNIINIDNDSPVTYVTFKIDTPHHHVTTIGDNNDGTYTILLNDSNDWQIVPAEYLAKLFSEYPALVAALDTPWSQS